MSKKKAWQGALNGMEAAKDHANAQINGWDKMAFDYFCSFARNCGRKFLTEEVVSAASTESNLATPDTRAWGAIAMKAKRNGIVASDGIAYSSRLGRGHSAPRTIWVAT